MDNEHLILAIGGDAILLNEIIEGDEVGDTFLVELDMWLVTVYLCLVSDEHRYSVTLKAHISFGLINLSNQLGITERSMVYWLSSRITFLRSILMDLS